jgi:hypothetical protein
VQCYLRGVGSSLSYVLERLVTVFITSFLSLAIEVSRDYAFSALKCVAYVGRTHVGVFLRVARNALWQTSDQHFIAGVFCRCFVQQCMSGT